MLAQLFSLSLSISLSPVFWVMANGVDDDLFTKTQNISWQDHNLVKVYFCQVRSKNSASSAGTSSVVHPIISGSGSALEI